MALEAVPQSARSSVQATAAPQMKFEELALPMADRIYSILAGMVGRTDAEDLLQESLLNAFKGFAKFRGDSGFGTWFTRIAVNTARNFLRKKRPVPFSNGANPGCEDGSAAGADDFPSDALDPLEALARSEDGEMVRSAVERLSDDEREVVLLREIEGLSYIEMASALGTTAAAVRSRLHRARRRLFVLLGGRDEQ